MNQTLARLSWLLLPLLAVSAASAREWPARAQMLQEPWRGPLLAAATSWARLQPVAKSTPTVPALAKATVVVAISAPAPIAAASASTPSAPPPVPTPATAGTVLLVGDSLMGEVARGMRRGLPRTFTVIDKHRSSTGLTNQGYYDWPAQAQQFTQEEAPGWVVIHLGANDAQDMLLSGKWLRFGSPAWQQAYLVRAQTLIDNIRAAAPEARVAWIGLPAMRSPKFDGRMTIIANLHRQAATSRQVPYLDGRHALGSTYTKQGASPSGKTEVWRADDGIHYARQGGWRLAEAVGVLGAMNWTWAAP